MAALLLGLVFSALPARAAALPDSLFTTNWYTVTILGNRSGYSCQSLLREGEGVATFEQTVLRVRMGDQTLTAEREERRHYDRNLRLISIEHKANQVGRKLTITARRNAAGMSLHRESPDGAVTEQIAVPEGFGNELEALQAVNDGQLRAGWEGAFTTLDCDLGKVDTIHLKVLEAVNKPQPGWLLSARSGLLDLETRTWLAKDGTLLRQEVPGMMGMALELATEQEALAQVSPLLLSCEIPLDRSLGEARSLDAVTLHVSARTGAAADMIPVTARQTVVPRGTEATVTTVAETPPELRLRLPVTEPALQSYLQPSDLAQSRDPQIAARARQIVGDETDAWQSAQKLLRWVYTELKKVESEPRPISAVEILQAMQGDCTEHAILFAALAQAVGLPVKVAAGVAYADQAYHYHAWNEVYVGRWVEIDPTWGEATVDAGHLQFASAALDSTSMARLSLASGRTMGTLEFKAVDCKQGEVR